MDNLTARWPMLAPPHCRLTLVDLDLLRPLIEQAAALEFLTALLSPSECALFGQFKYPKRRLEWLGGRLAAKHCLHQMLDGHASEPCLYNEYSLLPDAHGRPRLEHPPASAPAVSVSISHSRGFAAALACRAGDCGVDVQQTTPKLASVQERFATEEELRLIDPMIPLLTRLGLLWVAKESVKKCLLADHPSFFGTIRVVKLEYEPTEAIWTARCRLTQPAAQSAAVRIAELGEHLIACATGEPYA
jgi:phosphopantetheinyl transferase